MLQFSEELEKKIKEATPSLVAAVWQKGEPRGQIELGGKYKYYDLASVTKVVFTTTAVMVAYERKGLDLETDIHRYLSWFPEGKIKVSELLSHHSGVSWWQPAFEEIRKRELLDSDRSTKMEVVKEVLLAEKLGEKEASIYSDLNFWLLGFVLEEVFQQELQDVWKSLVKEMGETDLHFSVNNQPLYDQSLYAPTEDCPWRKKVLRGEVHDDNAWSFGGVSAHAGLFGSMQGLSVWALGLRGAYFGKDWLVSEQTLKKFFKRNGPGDWGLGFMKPSAEESSAGRFISRESIGHLGFTGTSFWFDTERDLVFLILSNRVHPTRENELFKPLRALMHDEIFQFVTHGNGESNG